MKGKRCNLYTNYSTSRKNQRNRGIKIDKGTSGRKMLKCKKNTVAGSGLSDRNVLEKWEMNNKK